MVKEQKSFSFLGLLGWFQRIIIPLFLVIVTIYFGRALGTALYLQYFTLPGDVQVPRVVGSDVKEAQLLLQRLGLELEVSETKYEENVKKNQVMAQDVEPGRNVREGRKVGVVVSLGPEQVSVPNLEGLSLRDAELTLQNGRLNLGKVTRVERKKGEPEEVLEQNPRSGKAVKKGTKVNLVVNMGEQAMVKVPRVESMMIDRVRESLGRDNLALGSVEWIIHEDYEPGTIIRQDPPPGKSVEPGTEVDLKVSASRYAPGFEVQQRFLTVRAPEQAGPQDIRVNVKDISGSYPVYQGTHYAGEHVSVAVTSIGSGEWELWINDKMTDHGRI